MIATADHPFAVAKVKNGKVAYTVAYAETLEQCYYQVQGWRCSMGDGSYAMAEQRNGRWVPV